jgi:hypothetical protein
MPRRWVVVPTDETGPDLGDFVEQLAASTPLPDPSTYLEGQWIEVVFHEHDPRIVWRLQSLDVAP